MAFSPLEHACNRHRAFLDEVDRLVESEFPYTDSREALLQIRSMFAAQLRSLESNVGQQNDPAVIRSECVVALNALIEYLPYLGYILRSTNVRNAFEVFRPLLRLARDLLEPTVPHKQRQTRLVLTSEWDYSPVLYSEPPALSHFVFVGLPAPESSNPLLLPLAGHELGHAVWVTRNLENQFEPIVISTLAHEVRQRLTQFQQVFSMPNATADDIDNSSDVIDEWGVAFPWAMRQVEESFCDFVGLRIFGLSYLKAFAYFISPNDDRERSLFYPSLATRINNLKSAAAAFQVDIPRGYESLFDDDQQPSLSEPDEFCSLVADASAQAMVNDLIEEARQTIQASGICLPSPEKTQEIYGRLNMLVPAQGCSCLADILNAAWRLYEHPDWWRDFFDTRQRADKTLRDLVLKNVEVFEIEQIRINPIP